IAYIWDPEGQFARQCNMEMVQLEAMEAAEDIAELKALIEKHHNYTDSPVARRVLENWSQSLNEFVKVMPTDYKRVLEERRTVASAG
ncbi:MAG: hypothetical protein AAGE43_05695, partial [Pseudomonadota bacterium]